MSRTKQEIILKKLILSTRHKGRLWAALGALFTGATLLLLSVLIWWNFRELLYGKSRTDNMGNTVLTIGKGITNENMGKPQATVFEPGEIDSLKQTAQVLDAQMVSSNHFPVYALIGGTLSFQTELPLESVPDNYLESLPGDWSWHTGQNDLPIILSSDLLDKYNYAFAPSQGLPQLSKSSVKSIAITLKIGYETQNETYLAHIVGFSDRINSVMVPQSFIEYGNGRYNQTKGSNKPSQIILKVKDPSDPLFTNYLTTHNYTTNPQNLRWSKIRGIVQVVTVATGILALLLMGISTIVFLFFIELTITHSRAALNLLVQLGYSPRFLSRYMTRKFLPLIVGASFLAMFFTVMSQYAAFLLVTSQGLVLSAVPGWQVWGAFVLSTSILVLLVTVSIVKSIETAPAN